MDSLQREDEHACGQEVRRRCVSESGEVTPSLKLRNVQKERCVANDPAKTMLHDHVVGLGKTFSNIGRDGAEASGFVEETAGRGSESSGDAVGGGLLQRCIRTRRFLPRQPADFSKKNRRLFAPRWRRGFRRDYHRTFVVSILLPKRTPCWWCRSRQISSATPSNRRREPEGENQGRQAHARHDSEEVQSYKPFGEDMERSAAERPTRWGTRSMESTSRSLGIDFVVDEAHEFRMLEYNTMSDK